MKRDNKGRIGLWRPSLALPLVGVAALLLVGELHGSLSRAQASPLPSEPNLEGALNVVLGVRASEGFRGDVLVARAGAIILQETVGDVPLPQGQKERRYWIGSTSKQFSAALAATLAAEGALDLGGTIAEYLQEVPAKKRGITIEQLLTHTSGLGHNYAADGLTSRTEAARAILKRRLRAEPGQEYRYSNDGYNLLAIAIEEATGTSFDELLVRKVLSPRSLDATGLWGHETAGSIAPIKSPRAPRVRRTIYGDGKSRANWGYRGATGLYSSTADLFAWALALLSAESDDPLGVIQRPRTRVRQRADGGLWYGYGLGIATDTENRVLSLRHNGDDGWLGHNSAFLVHADGDVVIVLSNAAEHDGRAWSAVVARDVLDVLGK